MTKGESKDEAASAWERALRGDFSSLTARQPLASAAERRCVEALCALVTSRPPPTLNTDQEYPPAMLRLMCLRAAITSNVEQLRAVFGAQRSQGLDASLTQRWLGLYLGDFGTHPQVEGTDSRSPDERVESASLAALESLNVSDPAAGVAHARRAVRIARADGFVLHELLASLVLARCRRFEGRPHLALRILGTVAQVAPPPWRGWVGYEQRLSGQPSQLRSPFEPLLRLERLLDGAAGGRADEIAAAVDGAPRWCLDELETLAACVDPARSPSDATRAWLEGRAHNCPPALMGLCIPDVLAEGEVAPVLLLVRPSLPARRLLALGNGMVPDADLPAAFNLGQSRTLAALAHWMTDPSVEREQLFERVYGFAYHPERHGGTLRVLLHRVRQSLPPHLHLDGDGVVQVERNTLLPDPRVAFEPESLVLRHLATHQGRASARQIADALGVSSRTVQTTLKGLLHDGTCSFERTGRNILYRLEDTTLSEPTVSRLHPRGLTGLHPGDGAAGS